MTTISKYQNLLYEDLCFHDMAPYVLNTHTPIHRWFLIPESSSLEWASVLLAESNADQYDFVIDPFCGSGTVGLAAFFQGVNYLGGDYLADSVIGSIAKLCCTKISSLDFIDDSSQTLSLLSQIKNSISDDRIYNLIFRVQEYIITKIKSENKYVLLSAVYKAIRACSKIPGIIEWTANFENGLKLIQEDLENITLPKKGIWKLFFGKNDEIDWSAFFSCMNLSCGRKGLLLSSPTFVQSSQDRGENAQFSNYLATLALEKDNIVFRKNKSFMNKMQLNEISGIVDLYPTQIREYLHILAKVLLNFRDIGNTGSQVILETANPIFDDIVFEVDYLLCEIAESVGFIPQKIRVIHYFEKPGVITYNKSLRRGSLVYLTL